MALVRALAAALLPERWAGGSPRSGCALGAGSSRSGCALGAGSSRSGCALGAGSSRSGYALIPDLRSGIAVWPARPGPDDPIDEDAVIVFLLPPDAEITWKLVRDTVRTELRQRLGKSATVWPPPSGPVPLREDYPFMFTIYCGSQPMEGYVMHRLMPRRLFRRPQRLS
jgi:hypothetical protein